MSPTSKNLAVGLTVLGALILLAAMIVIFAGMPEVFQGGYSIYADFPNAEIKSGDVVTFRGLRVGKVTKMELAENETRVRATVHIYKGIRIPSNVTATATTPLAGIGSATIALTSPGPVGPGKPPYLRPKAVIEGTPAFDLMSEAKPMVASLKKLGDNLNNLLETVQEASTAPTTGPAPRQGGLAGAIIKLNESLDAILAIMGDKENQRNIKETLARLNEFMANANGTMSSVDKLVREAQQTARQATNTLKSIDVAASRASQDFDLLTQEFLKASESASKSLTTLNEMLTKAQSNQGTLGKLLNDPNLYNRLVDIADQMSSLMKQGDELLRQWKDKGLQLHLR